MSGQPSDSVPGPSKAISSLAKKQSDVTRQGTTKLKFTPVLPARRKKEEVKTEPVAATIPSSSSDRGRGRGRGRGEGRGRGRGGPRPVQEMTASGPFAMGPAMAGNNARRSVPRSNFAVPTPSRGPSSLGSGLRPTGDPTFKSEDGGKGKGKATEEKDEEEYSDPDEGVEIVDMENVRQMDYMAPESLKKERHHSKKVKKEEAVETAEVDLSNALDLSESEEEEELEDIQENFARQDEPEAGQEIRQDRLYFFQFPSPFPTFVAKPSSASEDTDVAAPSDAGSPKKVTFSPDVKPEAGAGPSKPSAEATPETQTESKVDGTIGHLEIYRSGAVKMRLQNGIVLDVTGATQPSFLQYAVCLDESEKRMSILGEVDKRFTVSPDIETLLSAMSDLDTKARTIVEGEEGLIKMDTS